jgi:hypothetical protein
MKIIYGIILGIIGQAGSFFQLQYSIKNNLHEKYLWPILILSIPLAWVYIKSVEYLIQGFGGETWPSRLIGFGIGIVVFSILSIFLFKESLTLKTLISILLGFTIVAIQIFWK